CTSFGYTLRFGCLPTDTVHRLSFSRIYRETLSRFSCAASALQGAGWTTAAPHGAAGTVIPGMPGLASATRSSAGFGAPRYGAKPIVMPKPAV
ncbi:PE/PPE C-terminal domain-containing protein, partial [Mycobacterium tuberculosis]